MKAAKYIIFLFIIFFFTMLGIRRVFNFSSKENLNGIYQIPSFPAFTFDSLQKGTFQEPFTNYMENIPGLKGTFIRIRNQFDLSLFSIPHAVNVVCGKQKCLFGIDNIRSYEGSDFAGEKYLDTKISELKGLQEELWKQKKILLLLIFAPDKATFFSELIPDRMVRKNRGLTNYTYYTEKCRASGINMIDFNRYFLQAKDTSRYPLYTKTGAHWSSYGAVRAADSMMKYLRAKLMVKLPEMVTYRIDSSLVPLNYDGDISNAMNLLWEIRQPVMVYPQFTFKTDSSSIKPNALFIGDSYYWLWSETGIIKNIFSNSEFRYYDKDVYPETYTKMMKTWELDPIKSIGRQNVIVLLQTSKVGECDFGYGFVDRIYPDFDPSPKNRIKEIERFLVNIPGNMTRYEQLSKDFNAPIKAVIRTQAIFSGNELLKKKK
ncbi:MAG: hypothetical protein WCL00_01225 [Bacteroidota bacterium]